MKRVLLIAAVGALCSIVTPASALAADPPPKLYISSYWDASNGHDVVLIDGAEFQGANTANLTFSVDVSSSSDVVISSGRGMTIALDDGPIAMVPQHKPMSARCPGFTTGSAVAHCDLSGIAASSANVGGVPVSLQLGEGNDDVTVTGTGGSVAVSVVGGPGDDSLVGGPEQDYLGGGGGEDYLEGGMGKDRLEGGGDNDVVNAYVPGQSDDDWPASNCGTTYDRDMVIRDRDQGYDAFSALDTCEVDVGAVDIVPSQNFTVPSLFPGIVARVNYYTTRSAPNATYNEFKVCDSVTALYACTGQDPLSRDPGFEYAVRTTDIGKYVWADSCPGWKIPGHDSDGKEYDIVWESEKCFYAKGYVSTSPEVIPNSRPAPISATQPKLGQGIETAGPLAVALDSIAKVGVVKSYRLKKGKLRFKTAGAPGTPGARLTAVLSVLDAKGKAVRLAAVKASLTLPTKIEFKLSAKSRKVLKKIAGKNKKVKGTLKQAATAPGLKTVTRSSDIFILPS